MKVRSLSLVDFRNYARLDFAPQPGANVLLGRNGAGKTNVLEAAHLVLTGFSHRLSRDRDLVRRGCEAFSIRAVVERDELPGDEIEYAVAFAAGRKQVKRAGKAVTGKGRAATLGTAVAFSPDDLGLAKGPPGGRRAFLDLVAAKGTPAHRGLLNRYEASLAQRNRLLAGYAPGTASTERQLTAWTEQLAQLGGEVIAVRLQYLDLLLPKAAAAYAGLAGQAEALSLRYQPAGGEPADRGAPAVSAQSAAAALRLRLSDSAREERARRITLVGPHRDELLIELDGQPARTQASQGQQRSIALALRLAEAAVLTEILGERPLLLLDDVFSELDERRRDSLLALLGLAQTNRQTFVTATDLPGLPPDGLGEVTTYIVADGGIRRASGT